MEWLNVQGTWITDAGLAFLKDMRQMKLIELGTREARFSTTGSDLPAANVTDKGLQHLREMSELQWIDRNGTGITEEGLRELKKSCPKLIIGLD